eukprot:4492117-Prymnesium_polylepis.1
MLRSWIWGGRLGRNGTDGGGGSLLSKLGRREELGVLGDYRSFSLQAFDHFGAPFDHLRQVAAAERWQRSKPNVTLCPAEKLKDVNLCPVDYDRQDGHHKHAAWSALKRLPREWPRLEAGWQLSSLF